MMKNRTMYRKSAVAAAVTMIFAASSALAAESDLQAQIRDLAQKLEALQKQVADAKVAAAAAPAGALPAGGSAAGGLPAGLTISLFGTLDAGYGVQGNIAPAGAALSGSTTKFFNGGLAPSNFGVGGSVPLSEGVTGIFKLDTEFLTSTGANMLPVSNQIGPSAYNGNNGSYVLFNRAAYAGVTSNYGSFTLGRQQTVAVDAVVKVEPSNFTNFLMSSVYGAYNLGNAIYGQGLLNTAPGKYTAGISGNLDSRDNAMIKYASPSLGGLRLTAGYSPGATAGDDSAGTKTALGASYDIGPVSVGGSYTEWNPIDVVTNKEAKYKLWNFGVGYRTGALSIRAAASQTTLPAVTLKDMSNTNVAYSAAKSTVLGIGATYAFTPRLNVTAAYYSKKYDIAAGNQPKVDTFGLVGTYEYYKNTKLYAMFDNARSRGDINANQTLGGHRSANAVAVGFSYGFNADFTR